MTIWQPPVAKGKCVFPQSAGRNLCGHSLNRNDGHVHKHCPATLSCSELWKVKHKLDTETVSFEVKVLPYETCWLSAFNLKVNPRHFHFGLHFLLLPLWYLLSTFRQTWKNNRQPKQSLGDFWLLCNFFHRATSRNHCQPFGEYPFFASNQWLYPHPIWQTTFK